MWKSLVSGCLMNWPKIKTIIVLKCWLLLFCAKTMSRFLIRSWHVMKNGFYVTTSNNHLSGWTEKKLQSSSQIQTYTRKMSWSLFGGLLPVWFTVVFCKTIISEKYAQQIDEMHRNCNTCSWPWAIEWTKFFSMTMPNCMLHNHHFKIDQTGLQSFASSSIFTWPLVNRLPILQASRQLFAGKMLPQPAVGRKCFPRVHQIPKYGFLHYRNKQTYFSLTKMCW